MGQFETLLLLDRLVKGPPCGLRRILQTGPRIKRLAFALKVGIPSEQETPEDMPLIARAIALSVLLAGNCLPSTEMEGFACPVTKPAVLTFEPKGTFAGYTDLFGNERLFTVFPGNWNYVRIGTQPPENHGYLLPKIVWGSNIFDVNKGGKLLITGRRLDAASGPLEFLGAHVGFLSNGAFITSSFTIPTLGCWEVTGHFHGADLKIVVDLKLSTPIETDPLPARW